MNEGWAKPRDSRKFHYFRDSRSLCGKYGFFMGTFDATDQTAKVSLDDCVECLRRREKELSKNDNRMEEA